MCGLAGVASTERRVKDAERKSAFSQLLHAASWRGRDATGVACVKILDVKEPAIVYKKAIQAADFTDMEHYRRLMHNFDDYGFVIGHARSSTSDGWNLADQNAHPFQYDDVTMVHNGTIRNHRVISGTGFDHPVDSAHVAYALSQEADSAKVLSRLMGPFALVWHDARDGTLNFAKNHDKPLFFCFTQKENTMFWGSELEAIYAVLCRHGIKIDGKFKHCTAFQQLKFRVDNLRGFTKLPFANSQVSQAQTSGREFDAPWKDETRRLPGRSSRTRTETSSTQQQEKSCTRTTEETSLIGGSDAAEGVVAFRRESLRPTSRKKIRSAKERLLQMGRKLDGPICFVPELWSPYKNQINSRGAILGRDKVRSQWCEIGNVPKSVWTMANEFGKIYGSMVNVKRNKDGVNLIVCDYNPSLMERFVFKPVVFPKPAAAPEVAADKTPFPFSVDPDEGKRVYTGPGDAKLTEKEFNALVKHGCSYCNRDLSINDHETILWVGPQLQAPICMQCSGSSDVRIQLGIVERAE
jgi:hypothetical protein